MSKVFIDLETLPDMSEGVLERITKEVKADFKAPSKFTKAEAGADLGWTGDKLKFTAAAEVIKAWEERFAEEKAGEVAEQIWRKQALNPEEGRICSAVFTLDGDSHYSFMCEDEKELLECMWITLMNLIPGSDFYCVAHQAKFELNFLWKRSIIHNLTIPFKLKPHGRHGSDFFCTMTHWAGFNKFISQDKLCKLLGIEGKPDGIDGSKVLDAYLAGEHDKILAYNKDDVEKLFQIHNRINR